MSLSNPYTATKIAERLAGNRIVSGLPQDAGRAIDFLRHRYGEPITVLDFSMCLERSMPRGVWSAIHNPANLYFIPFERRKEFLYRTATLLKRTGWLVVDRNFPADEWLRDIDFSYERINRLDFGSYYAIRFSPKMSR